MAEFRDKIVVIKDKMKEKNGLPQFIFIIITIVVRAHMHNVCTLFPNHSQRMRIVHHFGYKMRLSYSIRISIQRDLSIGATQQSSHEKGQDEIDRFCGSHNSGQRGGRPRSIAAIGYRQYRIRY